MSRPAIRVDRLSKQYQLGGDAGMFKYRALRDAVTEGASNLARRVRGRGLSGLWSKPETFWALRDVSFEIPRGEVVGVVGRNGAGKSTLLKILSRITKPTSGGADLYGRIGTLLEVGTGFHPELSGRENIYLNGAILGMRRAEVQRNFDAIVAFSGVERFLDTPVKRYSSGMYVRLAFAVAAHLETEILLVDEVLAVGDAEFQRRCLDKMQSVVRDGRTIIFVSHNMAAVKSLCQRAILFDGGRIALDGTVDTVVDAYLATGRVSPDEGVLPDNAPRTGTGEVRLRSVTLRDADHEPVEQLYLGERFSIEMTFEASEAVQDVSIVVGISSLDGVRAATTYGPAENQAAWSLAPGHHRIALDLDMVLLPRRYTLDIAIVRSSGHQIDYVQQVLDFTAIGVARSGLDSYPWQNVHGYIRPATTWHQPVAVKP